MQTTCKSFLISPLGILSGVGVLHAISHLHTSDKLVKSQRVLLFKLVQGQYGNLTFKSNSKFDIFKSFYHFFRLD